MAKVRDVMTTNVVKIDYSATVLEAASRMNKAGFTGVVVMQGGSPVGIATERSLLKRFVLRDRRPSEVRVGEIAGPLMKIDADASTREAAIKLVENRLTRLGVFERNKLVGWVTLTDLARESTKKNLFDALLRHAEPEPEEYVCPKCRKGILVRVTGTAGKTLRWECDQCLHTE